jgi:hypothetical protein
MKRTYYVKRWWPPEAPFTRTTEYVGGSYEDRGTAIAEAERLYAERGSEKYEVTVVTVGEDRREVQTVWSSEP